MYSYIRYGIGIVLFVAIVLIVRQLKIKRKKIVYWISIGALAVLFQASFFIPIENAFVTFSSAEQAFEYRNGKSDAELLVINGKESAFVMYATSESTVSIIPKSENGWKLDTFLTTEMVDSRFLSDGMLLNVYRYRNTEDYYVFVTNTTQTNAKIEDNRNSEFVYTNRSENGTIKEYAAYVMGYDYNYKLYINGTEIVINQQPK